MKRFTDRVALLTGAGRGIGAATALRLAAEGAAVVVSDIDAAPAREVVAAVEAAGGQGLAVACDVTRRDSVESLFAEAAERFGRVDVLVACAGVIRDNLVHRMTDDDWNTVLATHLTGTFLCAQAAQRLMVERRYGRMVFLS
ncbi:MAG TPA: SDR family NAD(P)-dependent oxidoreductase, partial [Candidatus Dormibacteraeota bacterium]|nr:SDR family NAD(P)-dependent oxidoreductase [Candidatus Dormibacteraeota bacterium]